MEKRIEAQFKRYKRKFVGVLGKKGLYDDELDRVGRGLFSPWRGVNGQDRIAFKPGYQIINTDKQRGRGEHWVALYITPTTVYVYDSFSRPAAKLLTILTKQAKGKRVVVNSDLKDSEQFGNTEVCGQLCLSWLMIVREHGVRKALLI
jgi:hypothetical protein